jgi:hypothetical protein
MFGLIKSTTTTTEQKKEYKMKISQREFTVKQS